jgi:hypothetical protein
MAEAISQRHELPEILGRVLAARGVGVDEAEAFLNPTVRSLMPQPSAIRDMEKGAERLAAAVMGVEKLASSAITTWTEYHPPPCCCFSCAPWGMMRRCISPTGLPKAMVRVRRQ